MQIIIGSDHGGYELKMLLIPFIEDMGYEVTDIGCDDITSVDYPDYALPLAERVAAGEFEQGIIICSTGIGAAICANKVKGIRCALCADETGARLTREHNDSNVLALGGRITGVELAKGIVSTWLSTDFSNEKKHMKRLVKITDYEA